MKKIPYIIIAVWLLFMQGLNAQVDSVITRTGELGSLGDVFEFVDEAGKIVSYPRLTDAGEILYYLPLVTNDSVPASLIGSNSATAYANIVFNGWHETVTGQGFQLSTNAAFSGNVQTFQVTPDNAYADCVAPCNHNVFSYTFTGLSPGTTYYVRAYATNASGTSYSNVLIFSTLSCLPTVTATVNPSNVASTSAIVLSEVVTDCGSSVTSRGVCWGTASGPTLSGSHTSDGNGTGSFTSSLTGLSPNTTYYVRAYATNGLGTAYGNEVTFTTPCWIVDVSISGLTSFCAGGATTLSASGAINYTWNNGMNGSFITVSEGGTYTVTGWDQYACSGSASKTVTVHTPQHGSVTVSDCGSYTWHGTVYTQSGVYTYPHTDNYGCQQVDTLHLTLTPCAGVPTVTISGGVENVTTTTATVVGNVTSDGGAAVTARGIQVSTSAYFNNYTTHTSGSGTGSYTVDLTGLTPYTTYYVRAYATNAVGTGYSQTFSFTTAGYAPTLATCTVTDITLVGATFNGNVTSDNMVAVTSRGFQVSTSSYFNGYFTYTSGQGTGAFSATATDLTPHTTYYVRAYATNAVGTNYSAIVSFTTAGNVPTLSACTVTDITTTGATVGAAVTSDNGLPVTVRGIQISTNAYFNNYTTHSSGSGTGSYAVHLTDLSPYTTYYVRAYATNAVGTGYGEASVFMTAGNPPTLGSSTVTDITTTSATVNGNVVSDNQVPVTSRGVRWSVNFNMSNSSSEYAGTGVGDFSVNLTDLAPHTTYYYQTFATNAVGTTYSEKYSFTTAGNAPTLGNSSVTDITTTSATVHGDVVSDNQVPVTSRGVRWSVNFNMSSSSYDYSGAGIGDFSINLTNLAPYTTYYYQTFATNAVGTTYSEKYSFTTAGNAPTLGNSSVTDITTTSATVHGNVVSDNQVPVTSRGVRWSVNFNMSSSSYDYSGTGIGDFSINLTNLAPYTTYYYQTFATNAVGTTYSEKQSFTTAGNVPTLGNSTVTNITTTSATVNGNVVSDNQVPVTSRGVRWSVNFNMSSSSYDYSGTGIGDFSINLTNLAPYTTYYYQTFATNAVGTAYGEKQSFTTAGNVPTLGNSTVTDITTTSATVHGNVVSDNQVPVTSRGVRWSVNFNMSSSSYDYSGTGIGDFSINLTNLAPYTTYYYQTFATNAVGTAYGEKLSFTTKQIPTVTTYSASNITTTTAMLHGEVSNPDNILITAQGFQWKTTANGTYTNVSATGTTMSYDLTGLSANTSYTYRAFVTTESGTIYGAERTFTTQCDAVTVTITGDLSICVGKSTVLTASTESPVVSYAWSTGDNSASITVSAQGVYSVTASSVNGCQGFASVSVMDKPSPIFTLNAPSRICEYTTEELFVTGYENTYVWNTGSTDQTITISNGGVYTVSATNSYGCEQSSSVYVIQLAAPTLSIMGVNSLCQGSSTTLIAVSDANQYLWSTGDNTQTVEVIPDNTTYSVTVTGENGCSNSAEHHITSLPVQHESVTVSECGSYTWHGQTYTESGDYTYPHTNDNGCQQVDTLHLTITNCVTAPTPCTAPTSHPAQTGSTYQNNGFNGANYGLETETSDGKINSVTDYDGNEYPVVQIGSQCWLAENMRCTHSPLTGTYIVTPSTISDYTYTGKQARWYTGTVTMNGNSVTMDSAACVAHHFGLLYNWNAAVDVYNNSYGELSINTSSSNAVNTTFTGNRQGICPRGWHVPTDAEWNAMELVVNGSDVSSSTGYRGSHAGKLAGGDDWNTNTTTGAPGDYTNTNRNGFGFSAVPAGRCSGSSFNNAGLNANFWSSSQNEGYSNHAWLRNLDYSYAGVGRGYYYKYYGFSVRCLRDENGGTAQVQPTVTTTAAANITSTSATINGTITNPDNVTITAQGFEWKATGDTYTAVNATGDTMTYSLTGLTANTGYTYHAFVTTASGTSYGEEMTFTTLELSTGDCMPLPCAAPPASQIDNVVHQFDSMLYNTSSILWDNNDMPYIYTYKGDTLNVHCGWLYKFNVEAGATYEWNTDISQGVVTPYGNNGIKTKITLFYDDFETPAIVSQSPVNTNIATLAAGLAWKANYTGTVGVMVTRGDDDLDPDGSYCACSGDDLLLRYDKLANSPTDYYFIWGRYGTSDTIPCDDEIHYIYDSGLGSQMNNATGDYANNENGYLVLHPEIATSKLKFWGDSKLKDGDTLFIYNGDLSQNINLTPVDTIVGQQQLGSEDNPTFVSQTAGAPITLRMQTDESCTWDGLALYLKCYQEEIGVTSTYPCTPPAAHPAQTSSTYQNNGFNGANHGLETLDSDDKIISVTDYDGNEYPVVQIGSQCWLAENMRCTHSPLTGTYIVNNQFSSGTSVAYTNTGKMARWYNNDSLTYAQQHYGLLYNWNAAVDVYNSLYGELSINTNNALNPVFSGNRQGICPKGWHVPSDMEWNTMEKTVSGSTWQTAYETSTGYRGAHAGLLAASNDWTTSATSGAPGDTDNSLHDGSGFGALPVGTCYSSSFSYVGNYTYFWSITQNNSLVLSRYLYYNNAGVGRASNSKNSSFSVRCLRDTVDGSNTAQVPTVTTSGATAVSNKTAVLNGSYTNLGNVDIIAKGFEYKISVAGSYMRVESSGTGSALTANLSGLVSGLQYTYRAFVTTDAGTVYGSEVTFTTSGYSPATVPYYNGFDNNVENASWTLVNGSQTNKWYIGRPSGESSNVLFVSNDGANETYNNTVTSSVWAYRDFQFGDGAEFNLDIKWKCYGESAWDNIQVFVGTPVDVIEGNSNTPNGALRIAQKLSGQNNWQHFYYALNDSYANNVHRLYLLWNNDSSSGTAPAGVVDSIVVTIASCGRPYDLAIDSITNSSANVSFTSAASEWEYAVCTSSETPDNATITGQSSDTIFVLSSLAPLTTYNVYVRTVCSDEYSAWSDPVTFTTLCAAEVTPYTEDFNESNIIPACWSQAYGLASEAFAGNNPTPTTYGWRCYNTNVFGQYHPQISISGTGCQYWLISPEIDLSNLTNPALTFDLALSKSNSSDPIEDSTDQVDDQFMVIISTDGGLSWNQANATVWSNNSDADYSFNQIPAHGREIIVPLQQYANQTIQIAFYGESSITNGYNDLHIDNVVVGEAPACARPYNAVVSNVGTTAATVSWNGDENVSTWQVEYGIEGFTPGTGNIITFPNTNTTLSNLNSATYYDIYIRAACGNGEYSKAIKLTFNTLACKASHQCPYIFTLTDSYGDGWSGGTLSVQQNGVIVATIGMETGSSANVAVNLCYNVPTSLIWNAGNYDDESGFSLSKPNGSTVCSYSDMSSYTTYTFTTDCQGAVPSIANPTVTTTAATSIAPTTATLNGTVSNPDDVTITAQGFEWKPSNASTYTVVSLTGEQMSFDLTDLTPNTSYTYRAFVTYYGSIHYGSTLTFNTLMQTTPITSCTVPTTHPAQTGSNYQGNGFNGANYGLETITSDGKINSVTDYDGNEYSVVQIGSQCWLAENVRCTHSPSTHTYIVTSNQYSSFTNKVAKWYDNDSAFYAPKGFGLIYNWNAAVDRLDLTSLELPTNSNNYTTAQLLSIPNNCQGICPKGWHVPTDSEWRTMEVVVNGSSIVANGTPYHGQHAGKISGGNEWFSSTISNAPGDYSNEYRNSAGLSIRPMGVSNNGYGERTYLWSVTQNSESDAYCRHFEYNKCGVERRTESKSGLFSVRCIRNESFNVTAETPTVFTGDPTEIGPDYVTLHGVILNPDNVEVTGQGFIWKEIGTTNYFQSRTSGSEMTCTVLSGLNSGRTYVYKAFVTTVDGPVYGEDKTFTTTNIPIYSPSPCVIPSTHPAQTGAEYRNNGYSGSNHGLETVNADNAVVSVTDFDGNEYGVIQIGSQCWLAENLRCLHAPSTGTYILNNYYTVTGKAAAWDNNDGVYCLNNHYGVLYNWIAAIDPTAPYYGELSQHSLYDNYSAVSASITSEWQGICPIGWHLPLASEWNQIKNYLGQQNQYICDNNSNYIAKSMAASSGWYESTNDSYPCYVGYNQSNNNTSGFRAIPGASGYSASFWSATQHALSYGNQQQQDRASASYVNLLYDNSQLRTDYAYKSGLLSIRCLRDGGAITMISASTTSVTNITSSSATLNGTVSNPDNVAITAQGFEWKATAGGTYAQVNATGATMSYSLTGLTANTSYTYRAFVTTASGTTYGSEQTFTTLEQIVESCNVPTNLHAVDIQSESIGIAWSASPDVTGWNIQYRPVGGQIASAYSVTNSYTISGLASQTNYEIQIQAVCSSNSTSDWSPVITAQTLVAPTVTSSPATNITETSATLNGTVSNPDNVTITTKGFQWKKTVGSTYTTVNVTGSTLNYNLTGLTANTSYTYRAFVTAASGTSYGEEVTFTTAEATSIDGQPCVGAATVTDVDNNIYNTVQIGNQCWMKENLRTTHYADGTPVPAGGSNTSYTDPYYYDYTSSNIPLAQRGYLYNWPAAMHGAASSTANPSGVQGICPNGWHLPSDAEWNTLEATVSGSDWQASYETTSGYRGSHAGKLAGGDDWNTNTTTGAPGDYTNTNRNGFGFSAVPAGYCSGSSFLDAGDRADFWSSSQAEGNSYIAWSRGLYYSGAGVGRGYIDKNDGFSVRCLRDEDAGNTSSVTSPNPCTASATHEAQTGSTYQNNGFNGANHGLETVTADGKINSVTDYDGNEYPVVQIGSQCWLAENMRCTHSPLTGTYIVNNQFTSGTSIDYTNTGKMARWYNNDSATYAPKHYGLLYNLNAVVDVYNTSCGELSINNSLVNAVSTSFSGYRQGICPKGWHVPNDVEWTVLTNYVRSQSANQCDENSSYIGKSLTSPSTDWDSTTITCTPGNNVYANNSTGFSAYPAGCFYNSFSLSGNCTFFWYISQDDFSPYGSGYSLLSHNNEGVYLDNFGPHSEGFSVRCLRDTVSSGSTAASPMAITSIATNVTAISATLNGVVSNPDNMDVTAHGFEWKLKNDTAYTQVLTTGDTMSYNLTGLNSGTMYLFRAFVTTALGTSYGNDVPFIAAAAPTVTPYCTSSASHATQTGVDYQGNGFDGANHGLETLNSEGKIVSVTDYDGNQYPVVQIGSQCWLAENMRCTHSPSTGTYIVDHNIPTYSNYTYTGKQARWYAGDVILNGNTVTMDSAMCVTHHFGLLYNWNAVVDVYNTLLGELSVNPNYFNAVNVKFSGKRQGICPKGWHVPTDAEWNELENVLNGIDISSSTGSRGIHAGKLTTGDDWANSTTEYVTLSTPGDYSNVLRNSSGFDAVPAGRYTNSFSNAGLYAYFWSSSQSENNTRYAWHRYLYYSNVGVYRYTGDINSGYSVRCVRNEFDNAAGTPTSTTSLATDITHNTVTLNGTISNSNNVTITAQGFEWKASADGTYTQVLTSGPTMTYNLTGLAPITDYTFRAFVTTTQGTSYGEEMVFTTAISEVYECTVSSSHPAQISNAYLGNGFNGANYGLETVNTDGNIISVTDYDGNEYSVVQIGNQCWLRENMRCTHSPLTGTYIVDYDTLSGYTYTGKQARWQTGNVTLNDSNIVTMDSAMCVSHHFGLLYNWNATVDVYNTSYGELSINTTPAYTVNTTFSGHRQGICPKGWHVPTDTEWSLMETVVNGGDLGSGMRGKHAGKLASGNDWKPMSTFDSPGDYYSLRRNSSGFSAVPAGRFFKSYDNAGYNAYFWSSSRGGAATHYAWGRHLICGYINVDRSIQDKSSTLSVRCVRD